MENATRDSNETHYNKQIIYSCLPGYQFPDKQKQKAVRCTENETWTDFPPPCEGTAYCQYYFGSRAAHDRIFKARAPLVIIMIIVVSLALWATHIS